MTGKWSPQRVAMISMHTSPLEQPGTGDAGGMNVYVLELATRLAQAGVAVDVFTRATAAAAEPVVQVREGLAVHQLTTGPLTGLTKADLPGQLCAFAAGVMRTGARQPADHYDVVHSHYWLSGQAGWLVADRWHVPLVHTMHTMAKVKNATLPPGAEPEPITRIVGEEQVVAESDRLIANTALERRELIDLYHADQDTVSVIPPGVDLSRFRPAQGGERHRLRSEFGWHRDDLVILSVGRLQPLKGADVLLDAAARIRTSGRLRVAVVGGESGADGYLATLHRLAAQSPPGTVSFHPPVSRDQLAAWYQAADLVAVPSHSESFGLVALEAQACGIPVVAAKVGGLPDAIADGASGVLIDGHDPRTWATVLERLLADEPRRRSMAAAATEHAQRFGWDHTVAATLEAYTAGAEHRLARLRASA